MYSLDFFVSDDSLSLADFLGSGWMFAGQSNPIFSEFVDLPKMAEMKSQKQNRFRSLRAIRMIYRYSKRRAVFNNTR